jgi:putative ABC transport system substrate-binding protein
MGFDENDPVPKAGLAAFTQELSELGWTDGRKVRMDFRWASGSVDRMRTFAKELIQLQPDVMLGITTPATAALQRETRRIPIVFVIVSDPVGSERYPGRNAGPFPFQRRVFRRERGSTCARRPNTIGA